MQVGLGPGHIVLDGDPAPPPQKGGEAPKFSAYVYCGQTAGWIKMALGQDLISAGTHGNSVPLLFDSGTAVPTEMNGPTGTQSSQQFPQDFRSLIKFM